MWIVDPVSWHWDLKYRALEHKSAPIITRLGLAQIDLKVYVNNFTPPPHTHRLIKSKSKWCKKNYQEIIFQSYEHRVSSPVSTGFFFHEPRRGELFWWAWLGKIAKFSGRSRDSNFDKKIGCLIPGIEKLRMVSFLKIDGRRDDHSANDVKCFRVSRRPWRRRRFQTCTRSWGVRSSV